MFSNCCLTLQSQMVPPSLELSDGNCYLQFYLLNANILLLLTTQHFLLAVNCLTTTDSIRISAVWYTQISKKVTEDSSSPAPTKKVMLRTNLQLFNTQFVLTEVPQRNRPGRRCKELAQGSMLRKDSKTCDSTEVFR